MATLGEVLKKSLGDSLEERSILEMEPQTEMSRGFWHIELTWADIGFLCWPRPSEYHKMANPTKIMRKTNYSFMSTCRVEIDSPNHNLQVPIFVKTTFFDSFFLCLSPLRCGTAAPPRFRPSVCSWPRHIRRAVKQPPHAVAAEGGPRSHEISQILSGDL